MPTAKVELQRSGTPLRGNSQRVTRIEQNSTPATNQAAASERKALSQNVHA
jgi:hypothetical protein